MAQSGARSDVGRPRPGEKPCRPRGASVFKVWFIGTTLLKIHLHTVQFTPFKRYNSIIFDNLLSSFNHCNPALGLFGYRKEATDVLSESGFAFSGQSCKWNNRVCGFFASGYLPYVGCVRDVCMLY